MSNDYSFGLFDDMVRNVEKHLSRNDYAAGESFTAADTQLASAIGYTMNMLKILPERPAFQAYMARIEERPTYRRYMEKDREMAMALPVFQKMFGGSAGG
jgi:glutathione S-transferase